MLCSSTLGQKPCRHSDTSFVVIDSGRHGPNGQQQLRYFQPLNLTSEPANQRGCTTSRNTNGKEKRLYALLHSCLVSVRQCCKAANQRRRGGHQMAPSLGYIVVLGVRPGGQLAKRPRRSPDAEYRKHMAVCFMRSASRYLSWLGYPGRFPLPSCLCSSRTTRAASGPASESAQASVEL